MPCQLIQIQTHNLYARYLILSFLARLELSLSLGLHVENLTFFGKETARTYQLDSLSSEAIKKWEDALACAQIYKSLKGKGFTYTAIRLSISLEFLSDLGRPSNMRTGQNCRYRIFGYRDF